MMRVSLRRPRLERPERRCAWCHADFADRESVLLVPCVTVRLDRRALFAASAGRYVEIGLPAAGRSAHAFVALPRFPLGIPVSYDFAFVACSAVCVRSLMDAVRKERSLRLAAADNEDEETLPRPVEAITVGR